MNYSYRSTVMASEQDVSKFINTKEQESCKVTQINIGEKASHILDKPIGNYTVLDFDFQTVNVQKIQKIISNMIDSYYSKFECQNVLIAALGNENILADGFGCLVIDQLNEHLHLSTKTTQVFRIKAQVEGISGIESYRIIETFARLVKPQVIILLDSMIADSEKNLLSSVQISNTIFENIACKKMRQKLSQQYNFISIGYTTAISSYSTMTDEKNPSEHSGFLYAPLECGFHIRQMAGIVAECLNTLLMRDHTK